MTTSSATAAAMHWLDRKSKGIPDDEPVWTPEQWAEAVRTIRAKRSRK